MNDILHTLLLTVILYFGRQPRRKMADEEWDVMRDLHFLFASDEQLHDELVYMCDLLSDSTSDELPDDILAELKVNDAKPNIAGDKKKRRVRVKLTPENTSIGRQKREIYELRHQVDLLKERMVEVSQEVAQHKNTSEWEKIARDEFFEKNKSMRENEKLRAAVHEHATFIDEMKHILRKKPRLMLTTDLSSDAWQSCKLAAHASLRSAAIHAIADRQYARMQSKFIQAGVLNATDDILRANWFPQPDGNVLVEYTYHVPLAAPFHLIGEAIWKHFSSEKTYTEETSDTVEAIDALDDFTLYRTFRRVRVEDGWTVHSNIVYKYHVEEERKDVVWRSVLEDELLPHMARGNVHDESGWIQVTPLTPTTSRITLLLHVTADTVHDSKPSTVDELVETSRIIFDNFSFVQQPDEPGTFPGAPVKTAFKPNEMSFAKRTFVTRAKQMELNLNRVINEVVRKYKVGRISIETKEPNSN
ncbi:unnamed protein product [Aphanomyces euteiches]